MHTIDHEAFSELLATYPNTTGARVLTIGRWNQAIERGSSPSAILRAARSVQAEDAPKLWQWLGAFVATPVKELVS